MSSREAKQSGRADLELGGDGTDVVTRVSAPFDDSLGTPYAVGGPDFDRWGGTAPAQRGNTLGGRGVCVGRDSLRMQGNAAVSISVDANSPTPAGFIHFVKCTYVTPYP